MSDDTRVRRNWMVAVLFTLGCVAGCTPTIRLDTPEPVKIDVGMKVDVYTHDKKEKTSKGEEENPEDLTPQERRRNRMAEVQTLKNDRVIGEGKDGFLSVHNPPTDPKYLDYAEKVVGEENEDRKLVYEREANTKKKPVQVVALEASKRLRDSAYPGEWVQKDNGDWVER